MYSSYLYTFSTDAKLSITRCLLFPALLLPVFSSSLCPFVTPEFQEYVTVGQLNQIYGMPKVESSPTSPIQLLHPSLADSAFSCLPSPHGSSLTLSFEVCLFSSVLSRLIPRAGYRQLPVSFCHCTNHSVAH